MVQFARGLLLESLVRDLNSSGYRLLLESLVGGSTPTCLIIDHWGLNSGKYTAFNTNVT
jgi:hypothetical protein